mgnify:CR=1 FL=1
MTFSADTALLIFGGVALFGFLFFTLAMSEVDADGKRITTGSDLASMLFTILAIYALLMLIIFGLAVFGRGEITPWFWWTALGVEVVASVLLIPLYRLVYWVFEMISKTLDWAFKTLARVATSTARFCITSLTWWCGLFAPRKQDPKDTDTSQDKQA